MKMFLGAAVGWAATWKGLGAELENENDGDAVVF